MFSKNSNLAEPAEGNIGAKMKKKKSKKDGKQKRKDLHASKKRKTEEIKVDQISSVDEDCSRGMKKWLIDYKERRPGLKVLQQRIDEFMTAYEEQQEQERKEREARVAEEGWTVVVHQKGRKKTADSESGITVGSVSQAAVMDNVAKKKNKEVSLDFYRFQKRDAKRNASYWMKTWDLAQLRNYRKWRASCSKAQTVIVCCKDSIETVFDTAIRVVIQPPRKEIVKKKRKQRAGTMSSKVMFGGPSSKAMGEEMSSGVQPNAP